MKVQLLHMLAVGPQAKHVSEPHLYITSIACLMGIVMTKSTYEKYLEYNKC